MLSLRKPTAESIRRILSEQAKLDLSYSAVGATADTPPSEYVVDRTRIELGSGKSVFHSTRAALQRWDQFRLGWMEPWPPETPIQSGQAVVIVVWAVGVWWLNSCRIICVVDESGPSHAEAIRT